MDVVEIEEDVGYIVPRALTLLRDEKGNYYYEEPGYARYSFIDGGWLVVEVNFPWWGMDWLVISVNGDFYGIWPSIWPATEGYPGQEEWKKTQWYPSYRRRHWRYVCYLPYGHHDLEVWGISSKRGTQLWGFKVIGQYIEPYGLVQEFTAGNAKYQLNLSKFKDKTGAEVYPDKFKLSPEVLRRPPEPALVWYEDWRDNDYIPSYYSKTGAWEVITQTGDESPRPYRWIRGSGTIILPHNELYNPLGFINTHIKGRFSFLEGHSGKAGVIFKPRSGGDLWAALNHIDQKIELWQGDSLLASTDQVIIPTWQYTLELRCRGTEAKVWVTGEAKLTATITENQYGTPGIKHDCQADNDLFQVGDAYWYQPQEAIKAYFGGHMHTLGRIPRTGVTWDDYWGCFYLESGEEPDTRVESISNEWDYLHSAAVEAAEGNHNVPVYPLDSGVWLSGIYAGDADGFSVMYYSDMNSMFHLMNMAKHRWRLKGYGIWVLGMEDPRIWGYLLEETGE